MFESFSSFFFSSFLSLPSFLSSSLPSLPEGDQQAVECWTPFCLVQISFGIWQVCTIQTHSVETAGMFLNYPDVWVHHILGSSSEENISFCSVRLCLGNISPSPFPHLAFELGQESATKRTPFCPQRCASRIMSLTFKGSKIETTVSKHWGYMSSGFNSLHWELIPLCTLNRENTSQFKW